MAEKSSTEEELAKGLLASREAQGFAAIAEAAKAEKGAQEALHGAEEGAQAAARGRPLDAKHPFKEIHAPSTPAGVRREKLTEAIQKGGIALEDLTPNQRLTGEESFGSYGGCSS